MRKIALLSYGYLTADPRIITIADSLKAAGWDVVCINLYPLPLNNMDDYVLFKKHVCHNVVVKPRNRFKSLLKHVFIGLLNRMGFKRQGEYLFFKSTEAYIQKAVHQAAFSDLVRDVDVFYGCEMFFGAFIAHYAANALNKRFIFDIKELYSAMSEQSGKSVQNFILHYEKLFINQSMLLPCVSEGIGDYYSKQYDGFKEKYVHLPNTPQKSENVANQVPAFALQKTIRFVMLSGFAPHIRGIERLLEIWDRVAPKTATLDLYLSGLSDTNKQALLALAPQTAGQSLFIKAPIKEDDIIDTFVHYDVGIIPYLPDVCLNHRYCCPGKFGQYLKAGLMIVSSNTKGITKPIEAFQLGAVYSPDNLAESAQMFQDIISSPALVAASKDKAQQFFHTEYHWDVFAKAFTNEVDRVCAEN